MQIFIAADHRGFRLKEELLPQLTRYSVTDLGPKAYDPDDDFNDASIAVARAVKSHPGSYGIIICGSAHGVAIQANRFTKIRAICGYTLELAKIGRLHNDANILCLSADDQTTEYMTIIEAFLETKFLAEPRYQKRNARLDEVVHD